MAVEQGAQSEDHVGSGSAAMRSRGLYLGCYAAGMGVEEAGVLLA